MDEHPRIHEVFPDDEALLNGESSDLALHLQRLNARLRQLDDAYFAHAAPEVDDARYDALKRTRDTLAERLGLNSDEGLGNDHTEGFATARHDVPMLSLEKAATHPAVLRAHGGEDPGSVEAAGIPGWENLTSAGRLRAWARRIEVETGASADSLPLVVEPKIDGISISLHYENGKLVRATTRGDGHCGDVITAQVLSARAVPHLLATDEGRLEVRGELYLPHAAFEALVARARATNGRVPANPRNACAGLMKRKDATTLENSGVRSFVYLAVEDTTTLALPNSHAARLELLASLGLHVHPGTTAVCGWVQAHETCLATGRRRARLDHDIDGMVVKLDDTRAWKALGQTGHHPRWGIAVKFPPEVRPTIVRAISVQVGRSGALTPVAELEPVVLAGTTVSRASLHNRSHVERLGVRPGDTVRVQKAGEIIPQVVDVDLDARPLHATPWAFPEVCPACGGPLEDRGQGVDRETGERIALSACTDLARCPAQRVGRIEHLAGRRALDIEGLGSIVAETLVARGLVDDLPDLFDLDEKTLAALDLGAPGESRVLGARHATRITEALRRAREAPLDRWLVALAIPEVGESMARALATSHATLEELANSPALRDLCAVTELEIRRNGLDRKDREGRRTLRREIDDRITEARTRLGPEIGPSAARKVLEFLNGPRGKSLREGLARRGIHPVSSAALTTESVGLSGPLTGCTVVITGTLPGLSRDEAIALVRSAGGRTSDSVSHYTSFVVAGEVAGAKLAKASGLGIEVIDEAELRRRVQNS